MRYLIILLAVSGLLNGCWFHRPQTAPLKAGEEILPPSSPPVAEQAAPSIVIQEPVVREKTVTHSLESLGRIGEDGSAMQLRDTRPSGELIQPVPLGYTGLPLSAGGASGAGSFSVAVEDMGITEFIHLVLGSYLKVNYLIDPALEKRKTQEKVTLHMQEAVDEASFKILVKELLARYNVVMRQKGDMVFVEPGGNKKMRQEDYTILVGREIPDYLADDDKVLCFLGTRYVKAKDYINFIKQLQPVEGQRVFVASDNMLLVKTTVESLRYIIAIIETVDKPYLEGRSAYLVKLEYIDSPLLQERLGDILPSLGVPVTDKPEGSGLNIIAVGEINSLLLISPEDGWITTAKEWVERLDTPAELGPTPQIFIYRPQNRKASALSEVITSLNNRTGGNQGGRHAGQKALRKTESEVLRKDAAQGQKNRNTTSSVTVGDEDDEQFVITVDEARNALVIYARPQVYAGIEKVLHKLDVLARQVLVEVTIAEITLTDKLQYGVEWYLRGTHDDDLSTLSTTDNLSLGAGGVLAVFNHSGDYFRTMLNAFAKDDLVTILSRPRLVVLDNETASFSVGTDVPVITSEASAADIKVGDSSVMRNINYRKTGVTMGVTPTIYSNGILRLDISQTVSEAQTNDVSPQTDSPLILDRTLSTSVTLRSGQYILIGGLISESKSSGEQKIPLLGDIPWLGNLFKTTSSSSTRTEMLIQVRPVILENADDALKETKTYENTLDTLQGIHDFYKTAK